MHDMEIPESVAAIGRAGAGVNNIPVDKMTDLGVPVFNAPRRERQCCERVGFGWVAHGFAEYQRKQCNSLMALMEPMPEISTAVESGKEKFCWIQNCLPRHSV